MKHKPVAWRLNDCSDYQYVCDERMIKMIDKDTKLTPLYEHPKQTVTKKKIKEILTEMYGDDWTEEDITFARAILRKTQEADKIESLGTVNIGGVHFRNGKEVK